MSLAQKSSRNSRNDLKTREIGLGGRDRLDFGTVRPRVQIPGPRPFLEFAVGGEVSSGYVSPHVNAHERPAEQNSAGLFESSTGAFSKPG